MISRLYREILVHPSNAWAREIGYEPVFQASETSRIVIVGQAPGRLAQESGIPWNDPSGNKLREWLGLSKDEFYDSTKIALIPMDFYFPGKDERGDKQPRKEFAPMWHPKIYTLMPDIKVTILAGAYAQKYYLKDGMKKNLTETVRSYEDYLPEYLPIVHPSPLTVRWRSKNPWFEDESIPKIRKLVKQLL